MAIVGILITILLLILVFLFSPLSPLGKSAVNTKNVEQNATEAVEKTLENAKLENTQIRNIDRDSDSNVP